MTVSFFDDIVSVLLDQSKIDETIIVTMQSEKYSENKKGVESKADSFSWEGIKITTT